MANTDLQGHGARTVFYYGSYAASVVTFMALWAVAWRSVMYGAVDALLASLVMTVRGAERAIRVRWTEPSESAIS